MKKHLVLLNYFNSDLNRYVLSAFSSDDFRLKDSRHSHITTLVKTSEAFVNKAGYKVTIYLGANGVKYQVFKDYSVLICK